jgi:hypothetical protein
VIDIMATCVDVAGARQNVVGRQGSVPKKYRHLSGIPQFLFSYPCPGFAIRAIEVAVSADGKAGARMSFGYSSAMPKQRNSK